MRPLITPARSALGLALAVLLAVSLSGCYTVLKHRLPDIVALKDSEPAGCCYDIHGEERIAWPPHDPPCEPPPPPCLTPPILGVYQPRPDAPVVPDSAPANQSGQQPGRTIKQADPPPPAPPAPPAPPPAAQNGKSSGDRGAPPVTQVWGRGGH